MTNHFQQSHYIYVLRIWSMRAAIAAQDDDSYDYYLMKMTSNGLVTLRAEETDDYGCQFQAGNIVLKGQFSWDITW